MFKLVDSGDDALTVYLAETPGDEALAKVIDFVHRVRSQNWDWLVDLVPSYCCVAIYYDLLRCDYFSVRSAVSALAGNVGTTCELAAPLNPTLAAAAKNLPVHYGADQAPDLERVARSAKLSTEEVIALHSGQEYRVYALGFRPGFAFMGSVPAALQIPRLDVPRKRVPAGAVAIAGAQAAVYPSASPGGWNLIGRCPTSLFRLHRGEPKVALALGDRVRFQPVSREEYLALGGRLDG
ncbi:5-oxoprolinase subunit B family protein [Microbulbifer pacificus]|uniref:Carboxyltransferase domain-containing protein n=1 Tax=Microbulbifer pacificus TaxID=407164 RepID=A0AAU0MWZ8_9GAMM|nr:carboxyltransferase domain-containing protein [Microbulbifer pacificus]WOX04725.1 carboxyltransferase domain-containing protein [Microbulbifer pacificus]